MPSKYNSIFFFTFLAACLSISAAGVIPLPHVDLYMVCQTSEIQTSDTSMLETELTDYYLNLIPDATAVLLSSANTTTISGCVANDVVEIELSSDGSIDVPDDSGVTQRQLEDLITTGNLKAYLEPLCERVLAFQANVQVANSEPEDGWKQRFSTAFCALTEDQLDMSTWTMVLIAGGSLAAICLFTVCCCGKCGRRK